MVEHKSSPWEDETFTSDTTLIHHFPWMPEDVKIGKSMRAPRCECNECRFKTASEGTYGEERFRDYDRIDPALTDELTEHQYLLLPSHMFAFMLKDRTHGLFALKLEEELEKY